MAAFTFPFRVIARRSPRALVAVLAALALGLWGQPLAGVILFGVLLLSGRITGGALPAAVLQPPLERWKTELTLAGHDPMASNRWQPMPPPSRPMGPPAPRGKVWGLATGGTGR
jgi:hypothetical protein